MTLENLNVLLALRAGTKAYILHLLERNVLGPLQKGTDNFLGGLYIIYSKKNCNRTILGDRLVAWEIQIGSIPTPS